MNACRCALAWAVVALSANVGSAHFTMLFPEKHTVQKGESVTFTYQWGHPFEHQFFDAVEPQSVLVVAPDGKATAYPGDFLKKITVPGADNKKAAAYQFSYKPEQRGDYIFWMQLPPVWMEEEEQYFQDNVKVVLHVQAQKGWENVANKGWELQPLTRPYGLTPGMVFQARSYHPPVEVKGNRMFGPRFPIEFQDRVEALPPLGPLFEIERYNATPPKELPADEFITRTVRSDSNGVVTTTLTEPGWWSLTAQAQTPEMMKRDDKEYPLKRRTTMWVFVDDKAKK